MADLSNRRGYTPRRVREQRAYRTLVAGGVTGSVGIVTLVLAIAGVMGAGIPVVLLIVTALLAWRFMTITGSR